MMMNVYSRKSGWHPISGKKDVTVNVDRLLQYLDQHKTRYTPEGFVNSGYNIFEDYEKDNVIRSVVRILQ